MKHFRIRRHGHAWTVREVVQDFPPAYQVAHRQLSQHKWMHQNAILVEQPDKPNISRAQMRDPHRRIG
jgi:hypothetical protein